MRVSLEMVVRVKEQIALAAACVCVAALILLVSQTARAASGAAQWALADVGTTCFNLFVDRPVDGPRITATRQALRETAPDGDLVYVSATGTGFNVGDRLQVVRNTGTMRHPATAAATGHVLQILGVGEVVEVGPDMVLLRITGSCLELEMGDVLRPMPDEGELPERMPRMPVFSSNFLVTPADEDAFLVMGALESLRASSSDPTRKGVTQYEMYAQRDVVVIDQGSDATWQVADVALIYRDRVYAESNVFRDAIAVPPVLGRGIVVRTDASSAALQIVDSVAEIQLGDRARKVGNIWDYVNRPPSISCRAERSEVRIGESVRLSAQVTDPDNDPITISWQASAGSVSPVEGANVTYTASVSDAGPVSVVGTADDGRDDGRVECVVAVVVVPAPVVLPQVGREIAAEPEILEFTCPEIAVGITEADNRCKAVLDDVALRMRQDPRATVEIVGHSDSTGSGEDNERTSRERAEKVRQYLVETHGIDAARMNVSGAGSAQPIAPNDTPEGRLRNRRVEVRVTIPGGEADGS